MRKVLLLILLSGIYLLTSCAPRPDREALQAYDGADPSNREVLFAFQAGRQLQEVWSEQAARFSRENPWGITVMPRNYGYAVDPALELEKTGLPGLVLTGLDWGTLALSSGADLFPLLAHPEWGVAWDPEDEIRRQYLVKDDTWRLPFLPLLRDVNLLFVNLSSRALPEDPRTVWEEGGFVFSLDEASLSTVHFALGGQARDRKGKFREDEKTWEEAKTLVSLAVTEGMALPETEKFQGQIDFTSGKVPASLDTLSGLTYYRRSLDAFGASFAWDAVVYPYDPKRGGMNLRDLGVQIASGDASDVLASWLFFKWLLSPEIQAELADATGLLPVNPRAASLLASQSDPVYLRVLEEYLTAPRQTYPRTGGSGDYLKSLVEGLRLETSAGF